MELATSFLCTTTKAKRWLSGRQAAINNRKRLSISRFSAFCAKRRFLIVPLHWTLGQCSTRKCIDPTPKSSAFDCYSQSWRWSHSPSAVWNAVAANACFPCWLLWPWRMRLSTNWQKLSSCDGRGYSSLRRVRACATCNTHPREENITSATLINGEAHLKSNFTVRMISGTK